PGELLLSQRAINVARQERVEHNEAQALDLLAVIPGCRLIGRSYLTEKDAPERHTLIVVAKIEQHGDPERHQHLVKEFPQILIARWLSVIAEITADDETGRIKGHVADTGRHLAQVRCRVSTVLEAPLRADVGIAQVDEGNILHRLLLSSCGRAMACPCCCASTAETVVPIQDGAIRYLNLGATFSVSKRIELITRS